MKYFIDSEFMEDGRTIELLSLAIVAEDGREFYAVSTEADLTRANDWVREHVLPQLGENHGAMLIANRLMIRDEVLKFIGLDAKPEFWGYYADYDWVAFCQLFGRMVDLPKGFPMFCRDIIQVAKAFDITLPQQGKGEHHALLDARWNRLAYACLPNINSGAGLIAKERKRQIEQEGWSPEHDDQHTGNELAQAAVCYINAGTSYCVGPEDVPWPWDKGWFKKSDSSIRNLVKAGALLAAEIDRLQRAEQRPGAPVEGGAP